MLRAADHAAHAAARERHAGRGRSGDRDDQETAKAYAQVLLRVTGHDRHGRAVRRPEGVRAIAEFAATNERWMIAVRMVSEGVDVPRLAVGVYATSVVDPAVLRPGHRPVRACARKTGETATRVPAVACRCCWSSPAELEAQRDHVLGKPHREKDGWDDELLADANQTKDEPGEEEKAFTSLGALGRARPGHLRRLVVRHRRVRRVGTRSRSTSACRGCWSRTRCARCCCSARSEQLASAARRPKAEAAVREVRDRERPGTPCRRCARS